MNNSTKNHFDLDKNDGQEEQQQQLDGGDEPRPVWFAINYFIQNLAFQSGCL
jgi:hypothetical protein